MTLHAFLRLLPLLLLTLAAALIALITCSCGTTRYVKYDPATGAPLVKFRTSANYNVLASEVIEDRNEIGGGGALQSGNVRQDRLVEMTVADNAPLTQPAIQLGADDLTIYGTVDHSTPLREVMNGWRGLAKSGVTALLGWTGITEAGKTARYAMEDNLAKIEAGRQVDLAKDANATAVAKQANTNATAVEIAKLEAAGP